jgi:hypothetical protein
MNKNKKKILKQIIFIELFFVIFAKKNYFFKINFALFSRLTSFELDIF